MQFLENNAQYNRQLKLWTRLSDITNTYFRLGTHKRCDKYARMLLINALMITYSKHVSALGSSTCIRFRLKTQLFSRFSNKLASIRGIFRWFSFVHTKTLKRIQNADTAAGAKCDDRVFAYTYTNCTWITQGDHWLRCGMYSGYKLQRTKSLETTRARRTYFQLEVYS